MEAGLPLGNELEYETRTCDLDMKIIGIKRWRKQCNERAKWKRVTEKTIYVIQHDETILQLTSQLR